LPGKLREYKVGKEKTEKKNVGNQHGVGPPSGTGGFWQFANEINQLTAGLVC